MTEYYLIDKYTDNIISKHSAESDEDARMYFIHRKLMVDKEKAFDGIWNVVSKKEYEENFKNNLYNRQNEKLKYKWWEEEPTEPDEGFDS
jgi:hypothetical protein|tara:strand:- start:582 stop:851 length:270 start_codon:yes stop_codon:yes gene_type:complete